MPRLLFDTDVLIEFLRGRSEAHAFFQGLHGEELSVSAVTVAELYAGARDDEEDALRDFLRAFVVHGIDATLARAAGRLKHRYSATHGTGLADAMIAATVHDASATLVTFNDRHYPMVENVVVPWSRG